MSDLGMKHSCTNNFTNLVHRVIKSADHGRVEVAELVLVVANILLVAVWYLEGEILF